MEQAGQLLGAALRAEEGFFDAVMVGIAVTSIDREIARCNRHFAAMFGYQAEELAGKSLRLLYDADEDWAASGTQAWRALQTIGYYIDERSLKRNDGGRLWCYLAARPLMPEDCARGIIWVAEDISEFKRVESELRLSEQRLAIAVAASGSGIWDWDLISDRVFYSPRFRELVGYRDLSNERFRQVYRFRDNLHPDDRDRALAAVNRHFEGGEPFNEVYRLRGRDGAYRWFQGRGQARWSEQGKAVRFVGAITDITVQREHDQAMALARGETDKVVTRLKDAIESVPDTFALFDRDDRLALCNRKYVQTFTDLDEPEEIAGMSFEEILRCAARKGGVPPPESGGEGETWVARRMRLHRDPQEQEFVHPVAGGRWIQVRERRTKDGGIVEIGTDVTDLKASEERVRHLAQHDPLTNLPNRRLLQDRMEQSFSFARRNKNLVAVVLVDLDKFKKINDENGHEVGDEVLRVVAARLRTAVREFDTVARYGGDEFVVLLPQMQKAQDARRVADTIVQQVCEPIPVGEREYRVAASVGIGIFPDDGADMDALLRCADQAMYRTKQEGRNGVRFFSEL